MIKNTKLIILVMLVSILAFTACGRHIAQSKPMEQQVYICPIHKEYFSTQPGKCPKCGMELISYDDSRKSMQDGPIQNSMPDSHSGMGGSGGGHAGHY